jgi:ADP-heptose:LPS heptosyltransferase
MADAPSILAVHSGALGDVILMAQLLRRLDGRKTLIAGGEKARLIETLGLVDAALDFNSLAMAELFTDQPIAQTALPEQLGRHDRLVSCFATDPPAARQRLIDACSAGRADFLPIRPPADSDKHLVEQWCEQLALTWAGTTASAVKLDPALLQRAARYVETATGQKTHRLAILAPGSGSPEKCWPIEQFAALGEQLQSIGHSVLVLLGPVELDRWSPTQRAALQPLPILESPPLDMLAGVLGLADMFIGNDSGPAHLAAAVGTRCLVLFGPTRPHHFQPIGPAVQVLRGSLIDLPIAQVQAVIG